MRRGLMNGQGLAATGKTVSGFTCPGARHYQQSLGNPEEELVGTARS